MVYLHRQTSEDDDEEEEEEIAAAAAVVSRLRGVLKRESEGVIGLAELSSPCYRRFSTCNETDDQMFAMASLSHA